MERQAALRIHELPTNLEKLKLLKFFVHDKQTRAHITFYFTRKKYCLLFELILCIFCNNKNIHFDIIQGLFHIKKFLLFFAHSNISSMLNTTNYLSDPSFQIDKVILLKDL